MPTLFPEDHIDPGMAQFIRIDLFPAYVKFTAEDESVIEYPDVRVILTDSHAFIFQDTNIGPRAVLIGELTAFEGTNRDGYTATLDDASMYFKRSTGCGCGSLLRGIRPFPSVPHAPLSIF